MPILRDVAHTSVADVEDLPARDRRPLELDRAGVGRAEPDQGLGQLALTVALDAGHTEDLAGSNLEVDAVQLALAREPPDAKHRFADLDRRLLEPEQHRAADHHLGELGLAGLVRPRLPHDATPAQDGDAVGDLEDLVELVADEDDRAPRLPELPQIVEEILRLVRREHGRRLVQDEDLDASVQRLQDLHALLLADGEVFHHGSGIHPEGVRLGELDHALAGGIDVQARPALLAQDDVLGDREGVDQDEMLVDHADPQRDRVAGRGDLHLVASDEDPPAVRRVHAVQHPHERGLAGAVLSDQRMHLTRAQLEIHLVVGEHTGESLRDVIEHDEGRGPVVPRPVAVRHGSPSPA